ncbi:MAG: sugar phosphate isomerase/epimerase [Rhodothermales bacterium]
MSNRSRTTDDASSSFSRRHFLGTAAAAAAAYSVWPGTASGRAPALIGKAKGVKIGAITYSFRTMPSSAEELLGYLTKIGVDTTELMGGPAEEFAGAPKPPSWSRVGTRMTDAERAEFQKAREAYDKEASAWRKNASMAKFEELGKMYRAAGVEVDILKLGDPRWSDADIDYAFRAAKAVGARGISFEISDDAATRMGPFATKHQMIIGMHNHTQVADEGFSFDRPLEASKYAMLNLDIGHYIAGLGTSPIPIIRKYHDRISHLHVKDRQSPDNGGANLPWGQGDTPIGPVLRLLRDEQYPITAMIELEYDVPEDSDVLTEMAKCVAYCRGALS